MGDFVKSFQTLAKNSLRFLMDGSSSDDKRSMASPEDERFQGPDLGDKQSGHMMTDPHGRRGSKSANRSKSDSSGSKGKSKHVDYDHRRPSIPYVEEPVALGHSLQEQLQEQLQAKIRACERLESINQGLKNDLLKHLSDPYAKHKCSDREIEDRYKDFLHGVAQTARDLCEEMGYDKEALIKAVNVTSTPEDKHPANLRNAVLLLQRGYRGKFFQRSVAEMLLFRALLRFALPPGVYFPGLDRKENEAGEVLVNTLLKTAVSGATHDAGRLSWLEKWRLDTVLYVTEHESAEENIVSNKTKMFTELRHAFQTASDNSAILRDFINMGFEFGQILQTQKSIYHFSNIIGKFDAERMDFQDPQQEEYLRHGGGNGPQEVLICFYPALVKETSSETLHIIVSKGKALYTPYKYD